MNCPKCVGKLEEITMEGSKVDRCFICEGLWFDAGEVEQVLESDSRNLHSIDLGRSEFDGKEIKGSKIDLNKRQGNCPRCEDRVPLVPTEYHTITVDACPKSHGIWLDGGEIQKLRQRGLVVFHDFMERQKDMFSAVFAKLGFRK